MTALPAAISAQMAITQQNAAMSMIKSSANADRAVVNMLQELVDNVPVSSARGGNLNISA